MWLAFLDEFNGKSFFIDFLQLFTDVSVGKGYGAVCGAQWLFGLWPVSWQALNITILELYTIMVAVEMWGTAWANCSVCFFFHR